MQKINVWVVVRDHLSSLSDARNGGTMFADLALFYFLPFLLSVAAYFYCVELSDSLESALIAVFSVFAALLFSAQIGVFGLFMKPRILPSDPIQLAKEEAAFEELRTFFDELNSNISYLILLSCVALIIIVVSIFLPERFERIESAVTIFISSHFVMTLLMIVKRIHVAFALQYRRR